MVGSSLLTCPDKEVVEVSGVSVEGMSRQADFAEHLEDVRIGDVVISVNGAYYWCSVAMYFPSKLINAVSCTGSPLLGESLNCPPHVS